MSKLAWASPAAAASLGAAPSFLPPEAAPPAAGPPPAPPVGVTEPPAPAAPASAAGPFLAVPFEQAPNSHKPMSHGDNRGIRMSTSERRLDWGPGARRVDRVARRTTQNVPGAGPAASARREGRREEMIALRRDEGGAALCPRAGLEDEVVTGAAVRRDEEPVGASRDGDAEDEGAVGVVDPAVDGQTVLAGSQRRVQLQLADRRRLRRPEPHPVGAWFARRAERVEKLLRAQ